MNQKKYDLLLKNGTVVDPSRGIHAVLDVAFACGKVAATQPGLPEADAHRTINCSGLFVAPGMVDLHVHAYWGVSHYGLDHLDDYCITRGATTILDPGSAGADTFPGFKRYVIDRADTRIYALINVSSLGMISFDIGELVLRDALNVKKALKVIEKNREVILGVKVRLGEDSQGCAQEAGLVPLEIGREIADRSRLVLMVHPLNAFCDGIDDILPFFNAGDILTHTFHRYQCGILDREKRVHDSVLEARKRGVVFDVGHGMASFSWEVAESAVSQGFWPDTISSDLHVYNYRGPVFDLATTAGKFLHLGMPMDDVVAALTIAPARAIGMGDVLGTLQPGAIGDAIVYALEEGRFDLFDGTGDYINGKWEFYDGTGKKREAARKFSILKVVKNGLPYPDVA